MSKTYNVLLIIISQKMIIIIVTAVETSDLTYNIFLTFRPSPQRDPFPSDYEIELRMRLVKILPPFLNLSYTSHPTLSLYSVTPIIWGESVDVIQSEGMK
jgi:hypothetical protein